LRLVTAETPGAVSTSIQVARNVFVIGFPVSESGEVNEDRILVAVSPDEAVVLSLLFEAEIRMRLSIPPESAASVTPDGTVAISVPLDHITSTAFAVQDGSYVDLIATLLFVDIDEGTQQLVATETPDATPVTQRVVSNALVVHVGAVPPSETDVITLAVSPQDAVKLTWLVEANIPLTLILAPPDSASLDLPDPARLPQVAPESP
jgi:hypothetical protein